MEFILIYKIFGGLILFTFLLALIDLGLLRHAYEELYTHPRADKIVNLFGDMFYVIGTSLVASVVFTLTTTNQGFFYGTFTIGLFFAIIGNYSKRRK